MKNHKGGKPRGLTVERRNRLRRMREMYLRGITNRQEIAAAFNISQPMVCQDWKLIQKQWDEEDEKITKRKRRTAVNRILDVYREARLGFDRSRKMAQEVHYRERKEQCVACRGTGMKDADEDSGEWCKNCEGEGSVQIGVTTTIHKGQAGDPAFLRVAQSCINEIARLEGLHKTVKKTDASTLSGRVLHVHAGADHSDYLKASTDSIIGAMTAIEKLRIEAAKADGSVIDGEVIKREENEDES